MSTRITLLTQDDCASCDHAKDVLGRLGADYPLEVEEVRLDTPAGRALAAGAGVFFAPGVLLNGASFSHGRLSEKKLRRTLDRQLDASPRATDQNPSNEGQESSTNEPSAWSGNGDASTSHSG